MKRITLNGIKRRGLVEWKGREWWRHQTVSIWSREHLAWWRPEAKGYTDDAMQAWAIDFPAAYDHTKHCSPEKQIVYYALVPPTHHSSVWPAGCHDPNSCARHKACMYVKCRHDGRSIAGEVESEEAASSIPSAERGTP